MSKMQSAKAIRNLAVLYREMEQAATDLETLGSLEQATQEAQAATKAAQEQLTEAQAALIMARDQAKAEKARAKAITDAAEAQAKTVLDDAKVTAEAVVAQAENDAAGTRNGAQHQAQTLLGQAQGKVAALEDSQVLLTSKVNNLNREVQSKRAELEVLENQLAAARASIRQLLG